MNSHLKLEQVNLKKVTIWYWLILKDFEQSDIEKIDYTNVNKAYDEFNNNFKDVYNKHVPLKRRNIVGATSPFMNRKFDFLRSTWYIMCLNIKRL